MVIVSDVDYGKNGEIKEVLIFSDLSGFFKVFLLKDI